MKCIHKVDEQNVKLNADQVTLLKSHILNDFGYVPVFPTEGEDADNDMFETEAGLLDELVKFLEEVEDTGAVKKGITILKYKGASLAVTANSSITTLRSIQSELENLDTLLTRIVALSH